jgi:hypothetical protein
MIRSLSLLALLGATACGGTSVSFNEDRVTDPFTDDRPRTLNDEILELINTPTPEPENDPEDPTPEPVPSPEPEPVVLPPAEPTLAELLAASTDDFNERADAIGLTTLGATPDLNIQPTGAADFSGFITINVDPFDRFTSEIDLVLDFDTDTITATHGQFLRLQQVPSAITEYDGELRLIRGTIGESRVNDLDIDVRGTLRSGDSRLRVSANLTGALLGDDTDALIIRTPVFGGDVFTIRLDDDDSPLSNVIISAMPTP